MFCLSLQFVFSLNNINNYSLILNSERNLLDLRPGQSGIIVILKENVYTSKLLALGMLPKSNIKMIRKAPFGKVFYVKLDNHQIAIREEEAKTIIIE